MKVFVSSTVYDLLDARAELSAMLRELGVSPLLSDNTQSDFTIVPDANSIETCLLNVDNSDAIIVVLDQRYGPSLASAGFDDVSATHLEYRRAKKSKLPIYFYVRDRLEADFTTWRKNGRSKEMTLPWVRPTDYGLFSLLEEHRHLNAAKSDNNWYSLYSTTVDLKHAIARQLDAELKPQQVVDAIAQNRFPLFDVKQDTSPITLGHVSSLNLSVTVTNVGGSPAFNFCMSWAHGDSRRPATKAILAPGQSTSGSIIVNLQLGGDVATELTIEYDSTLGVGVREVYDVVVLIQRGPAPATIGGATLKKRTFRRCPNLNVEIEDG